MARKLIAIYQTMYHSLSLVYRRVLLQRPHLLHHLHHRIDSVFDVSRYTESPVPERSGSTSEELRGDPLHETTETENKNKNRESEEVQSDLVHDLLDWLQDFRENLVDESSPTEPRGNPAPKDRDTASSSHELPMESRARVEPGSGKHSVYTHFPKGQIVIFA